MCRRARPAAWNHQVTIDRLEHSSTLVEAWNYAMALLKLNRYAEVKNFLQRRIPVARRVLGDDAETTLNLRRIYARALYEDAGATLDDLREAVTTHEEMERTARRVFGSAHPLARKIEADLRVARAVLRANEETQP